MARNEEKAFNHSEASIAGISHHHIVVAIALLLINAIFNVVAYSLIFQIILHQRYLMLLNDTPVHKFAKGKPKKVDFMVFPTNFFYADIPDRKREKCTYSWDFTVNVNDADIILYSILDHWGSIAHADKLRVHSTQVKAVISMECRERYEYQDIVPALRFYEYVLDYKLTSDVPVIYFEDIVRKVQNPLSFEEKTGFIAAFISSMCHLPNIRNSYLRKLSKYTKLDSYGRCRHNKMIPPDYRKKANSFGKTRLIRKYKFTIAFENTDSEDYITEKVIEPILMGSVPVYFGDDRVYDFVPKDAIVNVKDFKNMKDLANYLNYVGNNKTEYEKFFTWKGEKQAIGYKRLNYTIHSRNYGYCSLFERIKRKWMNPYLTIWKRPNSSLSCIKCYN